MKNISNYNKQDLKILAKNELDIDINYIIKNSKKELNFYQTRVLFTGGCGFIGYYFFII